ncbi:hypothetical protein [Pseudomonas sp. o96-267]|uniref:hypothetical protein n=1 Tax=Pseudomonas sp. o96-267 TaxID=2479853 RepID=UPI000F79F959|nr:hypothetical protein [Pseudomonas sp. o96-267]
MSWDDLPDDLDQFASELRSHTATEVTADGLSMIMAHLKATWLTQKTMASGERGISIPPPRQKGIHPHNSVVERAELKFIFSLGADYEAQYMPRQADFQVCIGGSLVLDHCAIELEDHWRVDSHIFPPDPPPREPHPYIHFQRGGHAQDSFSRQPYFVPGQDLPEMKRDVWRGLMQFPGPRIPFPPHCPILAIDFAIGQHDGDIWKTLREQHGYRSVIKNAQSRIWAPFFDGLQNQAVRQRWMGPVFVT